MGHNPLRSVRTLTWSGRKLRRQSGSTEESLCGGVAPFSGDGRQLADESGDIKAERLRMTRQKQRLKAG